MKGERDVSLGVIMVPISKPCSFGLGTTRTTAKWKTFFFLIIPVRASRGEKKRKPEKNNYFFQLIIGESAEAKKKVDSRNNN